MLNARTAPLSSEVNDGFTAATLGERTRLLEEATTWMQEHRAGVIRTPTPWGEHVAVVLPTGVSAQFTVGVAGDYEEGIVHAIAEIRK